MTSALWKRSWLFRLVAYVCVVAMVAAGLVAVSPPSAQAASAPPQTITSGGPFTLTAPGGDLNASYDVAGVDPATMNEVLTTTWPKSVGLSPNPSLSDLFQATWKTYSKDTVGQLSDPPSFSGGSATATSDGNGGSTVTFDIPGDVIQANSGAGKWLQGILSGIAGALASAITVGVCAGAILLLGSGALVTTGPGGALAVSALGMAICGGLGAGMWTLVSSVVGQALSGQPFTPKTWWTILSQSVASALAGAAVGYLAPVINRIITKVMSTVGTAAVTFLRFVKNFVGDAWNTFITAVKRFFSRGQRVVGGELSDIELGSGLASTRSSGEFYTAPNSPVASRPGTPVNANCMDAYGSSDGASAGQQVAVNTCNGNPAQDWNYYSNGMISVWGLCLDTKGGTSSEGTDLVDLEPCNGSASQSWSQSGSTLVNKATSTCLNAPNGSTTPGTRLDVYTCNGSQAQKWIAPTAEPCDIDAGHGTACVAAYSTTRALYAYYDGPLYQVTRASDNTTKDIGVINRGGLSDSAAQDAFCTGTSCVITKIYDQSPMGNTLTVEGPGGASGQDRGADADALPVKVDGHKAYGVDIEPGVGYRDNNTEGIATDGDPEGMYMVASGTHVNSGCCFDFGNVEQNSHDNGAAHMDAVTLATTCYFSPCSGSGPWVQADLENGLFMGANPNLNNKGNKTPFVTAMLKNNGQDTFALKGADSTTGGLTTWYDGALPAGYAPMKQEGGIVLGTGGDDSNWAVGSWFEGVMTSGYPSDAADNAVQANITRAGYSGNTDPNPDSGVNKGVTPSAAGQAVIHSAGASTTYSSVFTVDSANGHLQETYLPKMGDDWSTQDLSAKYGTPAVMPGTKPVALVHTDYTSVFTVDADNGHLQETYLPKIGDNWSTQDLTAKYGTPATSETPTAVVHYAGATGAAAQYGFTSVYTVDKANGHLQETYLPVMGDNWTTQDLSAKYGTPAVDAGTSPVAIVHCGYTSVYTVDADHELQETYLPKIGDNWSTQSLSKNYGTPHTTTTPTAVVHHAGATGSAANCGYTSVYTVDQANSDLQETYLPVIGGPWSTQNLSAKYGTPAVAPGTQPVALYHTGYTSLYTVDQGNDHVQETYLANIGAPWATQDFTAKYGTPTTDQSPIVLLHPDEQGNVTWSSVFTVDELSNDLQETYLPKIGDNWTSQDLSAKYGTPTVAVLQSSESSWSVDHDGYASTYTVDESNGHLQETYLPKMGDDWTTQDLTAKYGTPVVAPVSDPEALVHDGYTSVYTVDNSNGHLQETYLPKMGDPWSTQDLSAKYGTPVVAPKSSPTVVFHDSYTSVYTVDASNGHLQETYLPKMGDDWTTQDLSAKYGTPVVMPQTSPVVIMHDGYTSVYTVDTNGDLQETYLPAIGGPWHSQDLSANYGTPTTKDTPTAVFHDGYTSVYTVDTNGDLQETYLPAMGDDWSTQDLSAKYGTPAVATCHQCEPVAIYHTGYTSVYTLDASNGDLQETYLPAIGGPWTTQDLSSKYGAPKMEQAPSPLVHFAENGGRTWLSVFSVDLKNLDLQETYLPKIGDPWTSQDLSAKYGTPPV